MTQGLRSRFAAVAGAVVAVSCGHHSDGGFPDGGTEPVGDARVEAPAADAGTDGGGSASPDAAVLAVCNDEMTCALPWTCDESDLLCEPVCGANEACAAGTFCRLATAGALAGNCVGPDYECLGDIPTPPPPTATYFTVIDTYLDVSSGAAVPAAGLTVKACEKTDAPCSSPDDSGMTDDDGHVSLQLDAAFDGYFDVTGPSGDGGTIVETLVFSTVPVLANGYGPTTTVSTAQALQQTVAALGTIDPTRAQLMIVDEACRGTPAFGASVASSAADGSTKLGYVGGSGISPGASTFPVNEEALAYAINVPGSTTTITTTYAGQTVNTLDVVLRPGILVVATLAATTVPSP